jgi:hypothetical protein
MEEKPKKSGTVGAVLGILFLVGLLGLLGYFGVSTLAKKSDLKPQPEKDIYYLEKGTWTSFRAKYSLSWGETTTFKHSVNFIPTAYEHYFLVADASLTNYVLVRADKNWYEKNFTQGVANDPDGLLVEGYVRGSDSKVRDDIDERIRNMRNEMLSTYGVILTGVSKVYVDTIATRFSIYEIFLCVAPLIGGFVFWLISRGKLGLKVDSKFGKVFFGALTVVALAYLCFAVHVISML